MKWEESWYKKCQLEKGMRHRNARGCMIREGECGLVP